ncbi:hypothetical protein CDAR_425231 [Caerostris darwini]|uniref:Uncharacterized protein n=1 Tax=Caerostris darwini TaxID=1538125 RepID=A0AAV4VRP9_9ARAC|nr:hypothetical protein CDAR_425231 [Caerostris darwini]
MKGNTLLTSEENCWLYNSRCRKIAIDEAPSKPTVYLWFSEFNRARRAFMDEFKEGHSKSLVLPKNINARIDNAGSSCGIP